MKRLLLVLFSCCLVFSCNQLNKLLCGELTGDLKKMHEEASSKYNGYCLIEVIPCENYYLNVLLVEAQKVDTLKIDNLHRILYDEVNRLGWESIHVLNKDGKFLFSHSYTGKTSSVPPAW